MYNEDNNIIDMYIFFIRDLQSSCVIGNLRIGWGINFINFQGNFINPSGLKKNP